MASHAMPRAAPQRPPRSPNKHAYVDNFFGRVLERKEPDGSLATGVCGGLKNILAWRDGYELRWEVTWGEGAAQVEQVMTSAQVKPVATLRLDPEWEYLVPAPTKAILQAGGDVTQVPDSVFTDYDPIKDNQPPKPPAAHGARQRQPANVATLLEPSNSAAHNNAASGSDGEEAAGQPAARKPKGTARGFATVAANKGHKDSAASSKRAAASSKSSAAGSKRPAAASRPATAAAPSSAAASSAANPAKQRKVDARAEALAASAAAGGGNSQTKQMSAAERGRRVMVAQLQGPCAEGEVEMRQYRGVGSYPACLCYSDGDRLLAEYKHAPFDADETFLVEHILDEELSKRTGKPLRYLVKWVGFELDPTDWEPASALEEIAALDSWEAAQGKL